MHNAMYVVRIVLIAVCGYLLKKISPTGRVKCFISPHMVKL